MKQTVADFHFLHSGYAQTKVTVCDSKDLRVAKTPTCYLFFKLWLPDILPVSYWTGLGEHFIMLFMILCERILLSDS